MKKITILMLVCVLALASMSALAAKPVKLTMEQTDFCNPVTEGQVIVSHTKDGTIKKIVIKIKEFFPKPLDEGELGDWNGSAYILYDEISINFAIVSEVLVVRDGAKWVFIGDELDNFLTKLELRNYIYVSAGPQRDGSDPNYGEYTAWLMVQFR